MSVNSVAWLNANESQLKANELLREAKNGSTDAIRNICAGIHDSTAGRLGTNKAFIESIMNGADSETLAVIMDAYSEATGSEIYKDLDNELLYGDKGSVKDKLESAYQEIKGEEYTGWDDGKLSIGQKFSGMLDGLKNKALGIFGIAGGAIAAHFLGGLVSSGLTAVFGAATVATIGAVAAPVLLAVGAVTAGVLIYKGVKNAQKANEQMKNATTDDVAMNAVQKGTESIVDITEGAYLGYAPFKAASGAISSFANSANFHIGGLSQPAIAGAGAGGGSISIAAESAGALSLETGVVATGVGEVAVAAEGALAASAVANGTLQLATTGGGSDSSGEYTHWTTKGEGYNIIDLKESDDGSLLEVREFADRIEICDENGNCIETQYKESASGVNNTQTNSPDSILGNGTEVYSQQDGSIKVRNPQLSPTDQKESIIQAQNFKGRDLTNWDKYKEPFMKAACQPYIAGKQSGIKPIQGGLYKGKYTHEVWVAGSGGKGDYRLFGYLDENGIYIWELFEHSKLH